MATKSDCYINKKSDVNEKENSRFGFKADFHPQLGIDCRRVYDRTPACFRAWICSSQ